MNEFKEHRREQIAELREVTENDIELFNNHGYLHINVQPFGNNVSISDEDKKAGSPKIGDMIARNPVNHKDQWLVAKDYYEANFEKIE